MLTLDRAFALLGKKIVANVRYVEDHSSRLVEVVHVVEGCVAGLVVPAPGSGIRLQLLMTADSCVPHAEGYSFEVFAEDVERVLEVI